MNDNLVSEHRAAFDLLDVRPDTAVLVLRDDENLIALWAFAQRTYRDGNGLARSPDRHTDAHRRTGRGRVDCALDSRPHDRISGRRVDTRVESHDLGGDRSRRTS